MWSKQKISRCAPRAVWLGWASARTRAGRHPLAAKEKEVLLIQRSPTDTATATLISIPITQRTAQYMYVLHVHVNLCRKFRTGAFCTCYSVCVGIPTCRNYVLFRRFFLHSKFCPRTPVMDSEFHVFLVSFLGHPGDGFGISCFLVFFPGPPR